MKMYEALFNGRWVSYDANDVDGELVFVTDQDGRQFDIPLGRLDNVKEMVF